MQLADRQADPLPNEILLSRRKADLRIESDPFTRFLLDNAFDAGDYRRIREEFAAACEQVGLADPKSRKGKSGKSAVSSGADRAEFEQMLAGAPRFRSLVECMSSDAFLQDIRGVFAESVRAAHPDIWDSRWTLVPDDWKLGTSPIKGMPIKINFQFGRMYPGAFLTPHKDSLSKIITLIFYMAPDDWDPAWNGGTSFYEVPFREGTCDLVNFYYAFDDAEKLGDFAFRPNRMVGFVKSRRSFHAVVPIACPAGRSRDSFIMNVKRVSLAHSHPWQRRAYRMIDRLAGRRPSA